MTILAQVQLHGVFVDLPSAAPQELLTKNGERIFFRSMMRDLSGACEVSVLQEAALTMAGCDSKESFLAKLKDGEMHFDAHTVRCIRKVKTETDGGTYINVYLAAAYPCDWEQTPTNTMVAQVKDLCKMAGTNSEATAVSLLPNLRESNFYPLAVREGQLIMGVHSVIVLVQGATKTKWELLDRTNDKGLCRVTTTVLDVVSKSTEEFQITGICKADDLLNYKFDKKIVLARLDMVLAPKEFRIASLQTIDIKPAVPATLLKWHELYLEANSQKKTKATMEGMVQELQPSPHKKLCRRLEAQLSAT